MLELMRFGWLLRWTWWLALVPAYSINAAQPGPTPSNTILIVGDSLSAGYGIDVSSGWAALLSQRLKQQEYAYKVVNASVSGETTGGGRARLPQLLTAHRPEIVVLELGANDGLRGLPLKQVRANLQNMIELSQAQKARVLLLGMQIPPNYGPAYADGFSALYEELARVHKLSYVPFFMQGVALNANMMQADNLHPNELGQPTLLENVWTKLKPLLTRRAS